METALKEKDRKVDQGLNMRLARGRRGWTQETLVDEASLHQSEIFRMEYSVVIENDERLQKVADALGCTVSFIKEHSLGDAIAQYITANSNLAENTQTTNNNGIQNNYYYTDKIETLYEKLLDEKDKKIQQLQTRLNELQNKS